MVKDAREIRVGVLGCGFWAPFQISGWLELPGVRISALYNWTRGRAEALAGRFGVSAVYEDAAELLRREREKIDVVDRYQLPTYRRTRSVVLVRNRWRTFSARPISSMR